jgi:hypothetical protein
VSAVEHTDIPVDAFAEMFKLIDGTSRGLPDSARIELTDVTPTPLAPEPDGTIHKTAWRGRRLW